MSDPAVETRPIGQIVHDLIDVCGHHTNEGLPSMENLLRPLVKEYLDMIKDRKWLGRESLWRLACSNESPLELVQFLVDKFPEACGSHPLHTACSFSRSKAVIQYVMDKFPDAVRDSLPNGQLPLHLVCGRNTPIGIVQCLVDAFPESIYVTNNFHHRPFDIACKGEDSLRILEILVPDGWTPLHFSLVHRPSMRVVQKLLTEYPAHAFVFGSDGIGNRPRRKHNYTDLILPLHCACHPDTSMEVVQRVLEYYPAALHYRDARGEGILHYSLRQGAPLAVLQFLAQQDPRALVAPNNQGHLPWHTAMTMTGMSGSLNALFFLTKAHLQPLLELAEDASLCHGKGD